MGDGTRRIFWLDILVLVWMVILAALGKWEWVLVLFIGLLVVNGFSRWGRSDK